MLNSQKIIKHHAMKIFYTLLLFILTFKSIGQINYRLEIVNLKIVGCDDGFGDDEEPTWKVWAKDNINTTWQGGVCHSSNGNAPYTHIPNATDALLLNITNTLATTVELKFDAWEDDNIFNSPGSTDRCSYDSGDDCRQFHDPLAGVGGVYSAINIQAGNACQWTSYTYLVGDFEVTVRLNWEFANFSGGPTVTGCGSAPVQLAASGSGVWSIFSGNGGGFDVNTVPTTNFIGNEGENYTLLWSSFPGCLTQHETDTVDVLLYTLPNPNLTSSSNIYCVGVPVNFTAENGLNFDFFIDSIPNLAESNTIGTFTFIPELDNEAIIVEIFDGNCQNSQTIIFTVNESPEPVILINGNTLSSSATFPFYQWYLNGSPILGATGVSHTATQNGTYTLEVGLANGCTGSTDYLLTSLSIEENSVHILCFPNPANDILFLEGLPHTSLDYQLFDNVGRLVSSGKTNGTISLFDLNNGIYFLHLFNSTDLSMVVKVEILK
jgi:hypothetical protein